jgi:hypothetical protein
MNNSIELTQIGRYDSGIFDEGAAEITAYDRDNQKLWVINGANSTIDILDLSDPTNPTFVDAIDIADLGGGINSIAIKDGIVAAAIEGESAQDPGSIVFFDTEGNILNQVTVGALPDMVTFTPDGTKVLVANEGEPDEEDPNNNPEGSISIIDLSGGVANASVTTADFTAYKGQEAELRGRGVRIFPGVDFANDAEPEYISVSPDGTQAFVTLQENNAVAVVDLETGEVSDIQPLGLKDFSRGLPELTNYTWDLSEEVLGTTPAGQKILLGGMSGLYYEGTTEDGLLQFIATPDRGPNGEPTDVDGDGENERPFPLPDYQPKLIRFTLDRESGEFNITEEIELTREDSTPLTGLPNLQAGDPGSAYTDELPVDLYGNPLENDPFGGDFESILVAPDGSFWLADEYRPAIYHFNPNGVLIDRFVPQGTAESVGHPEGTFGTETLPEVYAQRRENRGFEGMALNTDNGNLYAFIQSPIDNPDVSDAEADAVDESSDFNSRNSQVLRILEVDPTTGEAVGEYVYFLEGSPEVDKIGDAVYAGDGKFYVIERDSGTDSEAEKFIFEVDLTGATNILGTDLSTATGEDTALESMTADDLAAMNIQPVTKTQVLNLPSLGYTAGDKPEGLALLDDGSLAVINDNDFGLLDEEIPVDGSVPFNPDPTQTVLGIIEFNGSNGLDASDEDGGINIDNEPVYGLYQPDAIATYEVDGQVYYVTANEGDARDEDGRVEDLELDADAFPNGSELIAEDELGRLEVSTIDGDIDGDGDYDRLVAYGGRSFSIRDANGNLVFDSGDAFAQITAEQVPELFNSNGTVDSFDTRSNAKGAEPEGVVIGEINGNYYAFVGLERTGGVMVYDITNPTKAEFIQYINPIDPETGDALDLAPEGLQFISAADSPNDKPLLTVSNEISGTVSVYQIDVPQPEPTDIEFLGEVSLETGTTFADTEVGGISGLTYDAANSTYYALSDDRSTINDARFYDLSIDLSDGSLDQGDVEFTDVTTLLNVGEESFSASSIDPEGIALTNDGRIFISSEGDANNLVDPLIGEFTPDGQITGELDIPDKFLPTVDQSSGICNNQAFESLTVTPDGQYLFTATENALFQDGEASSLETGSPARIIQYDLETEEVVGEFIYQTDAIPVSPNTADGFADNGLVELLATDEPGKFLALERSFAEGVGNNIRLYQVDLTDATDVKDLDSIKDANITTADKELLLDFGDLGIELDNSEAIAFGETLSDGRQSLIVASDNNFSDNQETQFLAFAIGEPDTDRSESNFKPIFGTVAVDELEITGSNGLVLAGDGDDLIDLSNSGGNNRIYGGNGNDTIILGEGDRIFADGGDDSVFATSGGDNLITGGEGADQFWLATASIPDSNNVSDFTNEDVLGIAGLDIGFADLTLVQQDGDTVINLGESQLAILTGVNADELGADNFTFS